MPIAQEFEYHKPKTLEEAINILAGYNGRARLLAGGTDLIVRLKDGQETPDAVIDIKGIPGFSGLKTGKDGAEIKARVTFAELIESDGIRTSFPVLWEAARTVASVGVRNRATLAGNICSAVPSLDSAPALLIYQASVTAEGPAGARKIRIEDWFSGPKRTVLKNDEIVSAVSAPAPGKHGGAYVKLGRYAGEDLAQAGVAVAVFPGNEYRIAFCALGPVPTRAKKIEARLNGKKLSAALVKETQKLVESEISPISDIRASKEYRVHMAKIMLARALSAAEARLAGKGPAYGENLI